MAALIAARQNPAELSKLLAALGSLKTPEVVLGGLNKGLKLVNARNQCEALVHSIRKSLGEYGDKLEAGEKEKIEAALKDAEGVLKSDDKEKREAAQKKLDDFKKEMDKLKKDGKPEGFMLVPR